MSLSGTGRSEREFRFARVISDRVLDRGAMAQRVQLNLLGDTDVIITRRIEGDALAVRSDQPCCDQRKETGIGDDQHWSGTS
jgi:hypothetical protein